MKTLFRIVLIFGFLFFEASAWSAEAVSVAFDNTADEIGNVTSCVDPTSNTVSWWRAEDNASDEIYGTDNTDNGTMMNGATYAPGVVGQAVRFDGVDDAVSVPATALNGAYSQLSIAAWVYPLSHGEAVIGHDIYGRTIISNADYDGFALRVVNGVPQIDLRLSGGNILTTLGAQVLPLNSWSYIVVTYDGSEIRGYVNGQLTDTVPGSGTIKNSLNGATCLMLGNEPFGYDITGGNFAWHGSLEEVAIFTSALSADEIAARYDAGSAGAPTAPSNLVATTVSSTRIDLTWKDNSTNETGFKIQRKAGVCTSTNAWAQIATPAANVKAYQNTGLTRNTKYSYRIRAYNSSGNSAYSNCATATTAALALPKITSITPNSANVGDTVTISGTGFGQTQGTSTVTFNGTAAAASLWSSTDIIAAVPHGATTGNVMVTVDGRQSIGVLFTVEETFSTTVKPSSSPQTLSYKGVSITIPGGLLTQPETLTITTKTAPNLNNSTMLGLDSYNITLGQKTNFSQALTLKFRYDKTKLDPNLPEGKGLVVGYWDTNLHQWAPVEYSVNTSTRQVILKTKHLSTWVYWSLRGFSYVRSIEKHFDVYYYSSAISRLPGYTMRQLAVTTAEYLEHAYQNYEGAGFRVPGFVNVIISYYFDDAQINSFSGNMWLSTSELTTLDRVRNDTAHELFHKVQNRYFNIFGMGARRWWIEGTPDYAASRIAWESTIPLDQLNATYFDESIISDDAPHAYQLARFIEYIVTETGINFREMWDFVAANSAPVALSTLDTLSRYITANSDTTFDRLWENFVVFSFLDTRSSMPEAALGINGTVTIRDGAATATKALSLPATYTAKGFRVRAAAPAGGGNRRVVLKALTDFPAGTHVEVYRLIGGTRAGGFRLLQVLTTATESNPIVLPSRDALFVLAVNESNVARQISLRVRDVSVVIASLTPNTGKVGDAITIRGTGFGAQKLTSTVTFNGKNAPAISSWSDTSIVVKVPIGATTGNVVVTVGGVKSNGVKFTVGVSGDCINDPSTGLCWDKKDSITALNWTAAKTYCSDKGTRLPTIEELVLFGTEGKVQFAGRFEYVYGSSSDLWPPLAARGYEFSDLNICSYWSSTPCADYPYLTWDLGFVGGWIGGNLPVNSEYVRCVR